MSGPDPNRAAELRQLLAELHDSGDSAEMPIKDVMRHLQLMGVDTEGVTATVNEMLTNALAARGRGHQRVTSAIEQFALAAASAQEGEDATSEPSFFLVLNDARRLSGHLVGSVVVIQGFTKDDPTRIEIEGAIYSLAAHEGNGMQLKGLRIATVMRALANSRSNQLDGKFVP